MNPVFLNPNPLEPRDGQRGQGWGAAGSGQSSRQPAVLPLQVFSFVHAQVTFFHQGSDLLRDLEPTMKTMAAQVLGAEVLPVKLLVGLVDVM